MMELISNYFCGNKISDYGIEHGYLDYRTLAKAFDAVLNNEIMEKTWIIGEWEQISGIIDNSEEIEELQDQLSELEDILSEYEDIVNPTKTMRNEWKILKAISKKLEEKIASLEYDQEYQPEIFQYYIVSDSGAEILQEVEEIVFYNEELDMYLWSVTHWGTSWDYVLTDVKIVSENN